MGKRMAGIALFCVLLGGAAVSREAVPAWKGIWEKHTEYQEIREEVESQSGQQENLKKTSAEAEEMLLYAQSAVLIDGDSGRILYGKNEREIRPMASTTKIMTCILALELGNQDDIVTVSQNAASQPQVHLGVSAGRTFYLKDLLYSLMLESHNDSAVMIAEHIGGSTEKFAELMNQKARDLGCTDTCFITPNGLDAEGKDQNGEKLIHGTTAADLARIMRYCISESPKKEEFLQVTGTPSYTFSDTEGKGSYSCVNHNAFLTMMKGAVSGKTGFTGGAGYCYVGAVSDDGRSFIIALLGCGWPPHKTYKWADARKLMQYGMNNYKIVNVWKDVEIPDIPVENGVPESGDLSEPVCAGAEIKNVLPEGQKLELLLKEGEEAKVRLTMKKSLKAPVRKGDSAGNLEYRLGELTVASYPVVVSEDIGCVTFSWCLEKIADMYLE